MNASSPSRTDNRQYKPTSIPPRQTSPDVCTVALSRQLRQTEEDRLFEDRLQWFLELSSKA
jgi:hypothetical protein